MAENDLKVIVKAKELAVHMTTGERIKAARKKAKMTQAVLGLELGVSGSMVAQYETGARYPKYKTLERIAEKLGVSVSYLQGLDDAIADSLEAVREQELARNSHDVAQVCKWISVSERLPEDDPNVKKHIEGERFGFLTVLAYNGVVKQTNRFFCNEARCGLPKTNSWEWASQNVTHWMPLPEPPK